MHQHNYECYLSGHHHREMVFAERRAKDHRKGIRHSVTECLDCYHTSESGMHPVALITRTLANHDSAWIIGSTTNLWLDGEPTEAEIVNFFADSEKTGRALDVWGPAGRVKELQELLVAVTIGWSWTARRPGYGDKTTHVPYMILEGKFTLSGQWNAYKFGVSLHVYSTGASVQDVLVTMTSDITANVKYVHKGELTGILPSAIDDSRERRLVWLSTCSATRRTAIAYKQIKNQQALVTGFYATCVEPPPPPPEQYTGVLRGWRCYKLNMSPGQAGILQGDAGRYWRGTTFRAECAGKLEGKGSPDWPGHMAAHAEAAGGGSCGIYMQFAPRMNHGNWQVYASVVAWGNVELYTHGARCQYVRIEKLFVVDPAIAGSQEDMEFLERVYQVPVVARVPMVPMDELWDGGAPVLPALAEFLGVEELWDDRNTHS